MEPEQVTYQHVAGCPYMNGQGPCDCAEHPLQPKPTDAEVATSQNWRGMDGAIAWHLIERHADNWHEVGVMMNAWLMANGGFLTEESK